MRELYLSIIKFSFITLLISSVGIFILNLIGKFIKDSMINFYFKIVEFVTLVYGLSFVIFLFVGLMFLIFLM